MENCLLAKERLAIADECMKFSFLMYIGWNLEKLGFVYISLLFFCILLLENKPQLRISV